MPEITRITAKIQSNVAAPPVSARTPNMSTSCFVVALHSRCAMRPNMGRTRRRSEGQIRDGSRSLSLPGVGRALDEVQDGSLHLQPHGRIGKLIRRDRPESGADGLPFQEPVEHPRIHV